MRAAFVLGSPNAMVVGQLVSLKVDCIYYFSAHELSLPAFPVPCCRLPNPQLDALEEYRIVDCCIDRNILNIIFLGDDAAIVRRALRLSELRVEAKCYLNSVAFLQNQLVQAGNSIESVTFISHYLVPADVVPVSDISVYWHHAPHTRFLGLIPGLRRLIFLLQIFGSRKVRRQRNLVR